MNDITNPCENEERYKRLLESVTDYIYRVDMTNGLPVSTLHSSACVAVTGYTAADYQADPYLWYEMIYKEDRAAVTTQVNQILAQQPVTPLEHRIIHKNGDIRWVRNTPAPHYNDQGCLVGYDGSVVDITERKTLEEVWRRYEFIVNTSKDLMTLIDRNHCYVAVNEAYSLALHKPQANIIGRSVAEVWGEERYRAQIKPSLDQCLDGEVVHYQGWFDIADQGRRCFDVAYYPYHDANKTVTHVVVVSRDITTLMRAEEEIERRNRELELLNQVIAASAAGAEPEVILNTACRELARAFNLPHAVAAILNEDKTAAAIVAAYQTDGPMLVEQTITVATSPAWQYALAQQTPLIVYDAPRDPRLAAASPLAWERQVASFLLLPLIVSGNVVGGLGLAAITPRHFTTDEVTLAWSVADQVAGALAHTWLNQAHRRLSAALEQTVDNVIITDPTGKIVYVNPAFEQTSGYSQAEVIGQNPRLFQSGQQDPSFYVTLWQTIAGGQVWQGRFVNKKKDGAFYILDATITPVRSEEGVIVNYVAVERDVTQVLHLEEQLRQAQKMEAIRRLAGGVAHDFNNILTVINGHSELLLYRYLDPADPVRWEVEQIQEAGERAAVLTHQLLAFSRRQAVKLQLLNLNEVITGFQKMMRRLMGEDIHLMLKLDPQLGQIKADQGQMEQVLLNLVVNARDAMPGGGQLTLETANINLDESYIAQHLDTTPGPYVLLTVTDTGIGLDAATQSHIFEPFFTTKEPGKGTGLGLSTVYGIIRQSQGSIWVYSEVGQGTIFKIYLPRQVTTDHEETLGSAPPPVTSLAGTETILLVEDEANVRLLAHKFLRQQGYTVLETGHPKKALDLCQTYQGHIDLLITDMIMPEMNGRELAERLCRIVTNLKVLYISGYASDALNEHGLLGTRITFLEKPFSSEALARKVRETLDAR